MSYCVHCGVELDKTANRCPLCNTPVLNPNQPIDKGARMPFPQKRGQVERVKHSDLALLLSIVLASTAFSCGILNMLVFKGSPWSLYIIGACILIWVFFIPLIIYSKLPIYLSIVFDMLAVGFYIYIIAYEFPGDSWYPRLALPIMALVTALILLFVFLKRHFKTSILSTAIYLFSEIAVLCIGLELLIRNYLKTALRLTWSSVVFVSCTVIIIALLTIITRSRLREAVRRRMHM